MDGPEVHKSSLVSEKTSLSYRLNVSEILRWVGGHHSPALDRSVELRAEMDSWAYNMAEKTDVEKHRSIFKS